MLTNKMLPKWLRDFLDCIVVSSGKCKPIVRQHRKFGRNERCRCGCGKKYKFHLWADDERKGIR